jgi:hypothetical protein
MLLEPIDFRFAAGQRVAIGHRRVSGMFLQGSAEV